MPNQNEDYEELGENERINKVLYGILIIVSLGLIIWAIVSLSNYYKNIP